MEYFARKTPKNEMVLWVFPAEFLKYHFMKIKIPFDILRDLTVFNGLVDG